MRRQLEELLGFMDGRVDAEKRIAQLLNNEPLLGQIAGQALSDGDEGRGISHGRTAEDRTAVAEAEAVDLGEFSELLEKDFKVKKDDSEKLQQLVRNLALAAQSRSETTTISSNAIKSIKSLIAGIDKMLTEQMNEILHAPEVREMEGTWRGLWYLVNNTETDQKLKIRVMNISKEQLADTLEDYEGQMWDQSPIFKKVYTDEYSMLGGEPYRLPDRRLRVLEPSARRRPAAQHVGHLRLGAYAVHRRRLAAPVPHGQLAGTAQPAGPAADRLEPGLCLVAVAARERGRPLHRPDHAARAGAAALWRRDRAGEGLRLRGGGAGRPQQICLDERRLPDGRQHQPQPQALRLGHARSAASRTAAPCSTCRCTASRPTTARSR